MVPEILCIGMGTVDLLSVGVKEIKLDGQTHLVKSNGMKTGGDATNESVTLYNLGHNTALVTAVGADDAGNFYKMKCEQAGLDISGIKVDPDYPTAVSMVLIGNDGERSFLAIPENAASMMRFTVPETIEIKEGLKAVSLASLFYTRGQKDEDMAALLHEAREVGAVTFADMVLDLKNLTLKDIEKTMKELDYIIPSYDEAVYFTGKTEPEDIAEVFHSYGVKNVVVKLGAKGVFGSSEGKTYRVATVAEKVVDTTGAGDNFMAGFISAIVRGMNMEDALYFGSSTSAISIGAVGATGAVKSFDQVKTYMDSHRK